MCDALHELMKDDLVQAWLEGYRQGWREGRMEALEDLQNSRLAAIPGVMSGLDYSAEQAMDLLEIPAEEREFYRARL